MVFAILNTDLNEQQLMMLRLLKTPLPEGDFLLMRRLAVQLLSKRLDETITDWEAKANLSADDYDALSMGHFRSKIQDRN